MNNPKLVIGISAILLAIAVAAGAFGAHALKNTLSAERLETWQTAVQYHAWHALGLMIIVLVGSFFQINVSVPVWLIFGGILIFSGSLYTLCLSGISWLGAITPIGGVGFILGWVWFAFIILTHKS